MKIITQKLGVDFETEAVGIYLSQILTDVDHTTKRLRNTKQKWNVIKSILESVCSSNQPFNFLIFPEIAIPYAYIDKFINVIEQEFPDNTVTIFGIEIKSVEDYGTVVENLGIQAEEANRLLQKADKKRPVNACLTVVKPKKSKCLYFLQLKITHSKYEGALDNIENLLSSNFIYYFNSRNLNFITLICSDFFNRPAGSLAKIIDEIDYKILKKGLPLDFIINIQYNPYPDHELFLHSLNRIYDDGYKSHEHLCTVFLNSIISGNRKGGLSKVILYKNSTLPERQPLKQIDAPVVGYEFPESEMLIYLSFERLPKSWDPKRDVYPLHFECHKLVGNRWVPSKKDNIRYIAPIGKEASLDFQTYEELAYRLSNLGKLDRSIEWAEKAQKHWEKQKNYLKAAPMRLFIAIQYRHQGKFRESLKNYALAESLVLGVENLTPQTKLTRWRIKAGKVMVEYYLIKGDCRRAYKEYDEVIEEIDNYLENQQIDDNYRKKIQLYKIHAIRQQAEMLRMLGKYNKALRLFRKAYKQYKYVYAEEKAYSVFGQGDSLRMLGDFDGAMIKYKEAMEFTQEKRSKRLLSRVLRSMAELHRTSGREIRNFLDELRELSNEINYFFGKLYYFLIAGGLNLKENTKKAEKFFEDASSLAQMQGDHLKIEYAHSIFGLAEVKRLSGDIKAAEFYNEAHKLYKETGVLWGIIRTSIGIAMTDASNSELKRSIKRLKSSDPIDRDFITRFSNGELKQHDILFLNIP